MEDIKFTFNDLAYYAVFANIILGVLFGTLPFLAGFLLKSQKFGWYGLVLTIVGGAILGVFLAYPLSLLFLWLVIKKRPSSPDSAQ